MFDLVGDVDWDDDGATEDGQRNEHVAAHSCKTEEDGRIEADAVHIVVLIRLENRLIPGKQRLVERRRSVLLVGIAEAGSVNDGVERTQQEEGQEDSTGDTERGSNGNNDSACIHLEHVVNVKPRHVFTIRVPGLPTDYRS